MSPAKPPAMRRAPHVLVDDLKTPEGAPRGLPDDLTALNDWFLQPLSPATTKIEQNRRNANRRPWDEIDPLRTQQLNVDIPTILHAKLRWVVQSTYGLTMRQFIIEALESAVERSLKDQNDANE